MFCSVLVARYLQRHTGTGYTDDGHNRSFNNSFTLNANVTYTGTSRSDSYSQVIDASSWNATRGVITYEEFADVNGKRHA
ncbi:MAG: hypothetical protein ACP5E9_00825 [Candidatus Methanospirareceae archaeon]